MADDELDTLYWVPPDAFTAERTKLAKAAKQRGDAAAAKRISAARKPTTAAWIVNRLAIGHRQARTLISELGDSLRAAHAAMDGVQIRELSARQHSLIDELTRAAIDTAEVKTPSSAVRDDIAGTLQAAIADPEVRGRLGRLAKAERWSGFGEFGDVAPVSATARAERQTAPPNPKRSAGARQRDKGAKDALDTQAARRQREKLTAAVAAAEHAQAKADRVLAAREADRDTARQLRDEALATLRAAERELSGAEKRYEQAQQASQAAGKSVKEAAKKAGLG
ncbi:MAG: hypothetical protein QOG19_2717 [Mycobacterium sp.]|nr:hypothetical protein [Mycobacterium sp.]